MECRVRSKGLKTSSNEDNSPDHQVIDDAGTGRFYECIFCKGGFSTAQALGGHMNIHRKDRVRIREDPVASQKADGESVSYRCSRNSPLVLESLRSYPIYFPASTSGTREALPVNNSDSLMRPQELSLFGQELQLSLGMHVDGEEREGEKEEEKEEHQLDLELRLGHEAW